MQESWWRQPDSNRHLQSSMTGRVPYSMSSCVCFVRFTPYIKTQTGQDGSVFRRIQRQLKRKRKNKPKLFYCRIFIFGVAVVWNKQDYDYTPNSTSIEDLSPWVRKVGLEPTTSRLWALRAANCSTPPYTEVLKATEKTRTPMQIKGTWKPFNTLALCQSKSISI